MFTNKCRQLVSLGVGFALGLFVAGLWSCIPVVEKVSADTTVKGAETARYNISAYGDGKAGGAYIIDVNTGEVFLVRSDFTPAKSLGRVEKK